MSQDTGPAPLLSILIPAYRYPEGVLRILRQLARGSHPAFDFEVLVSDDSPDAGMGGPVRELARQLGLPLLYRHNAPAFGAPANWNQLLERARGRYVWLLHHDEYPLDDDFLAALGERLSRQDAPQVLMLDCVLVDPASGANRRHLPNWLRQAVVRRAPSYLWRRNVIGPTSALVVARACFPRFDGQLRWLVDVDVYTRLFQQRPRWRLAHELAVGSLLHRSDSITATLRAELADVRRQEQHYLLTRPDTAAPAWLHHMSGGAGRVLCVLETLAWTGIRIVTRTAAGLGLGGRGRMQIRQALRATSKPELP